MNRFIGLFLFCATLISCGDKKAREGVYRFDYETYDGYEDGTYCAEIEYYYSKTGTRSTYELEVEVEDNELVKIYWPNGGWLDESHFDAPDISDGQASFESDIGVEYSVEITGDEGTCYASRAPTEKDFVEDEEEEHVCSRCGGKKYYSYDEYCEDCTEELEEEHTCQRCGGEKFFSTDDYCSSCTNELEEDEEEY